MIKLTVFAMTKKGMAVVTSIHAKHPDLIETVVSSRDDGVTDDGYDQLQRFCEANDIAFCGRRECRAIHTEYALAVSWRWLLDSDSSRVIVMHDSLLPRNRGFNPLVTALINGDTEIGVTALYASAEYDKGDIIGQSRSTITYPITISEAINVIVKDYSTLAVEIADGLSLGQDLAATPQSEDGASYSLWRDELDYFIDWAASAVTIRRTVDALGPPYMGAASIVDGTIVRVAKAEALEDVVVENRTPGKVIFIQESKPVVVCGTGLLRIDELLDESGATVLPLRSFRSRFTGPAGSGGG